MVPVTFQSEESTGFKVETINEPAEVLHFVKFETRYIESCLDFITKECPALRNGSSGHKQGQHLKATGILCSYCSVCSVYVCVCVRVCLSVSVFCANGVGWGGGGGGT